MMALVKLGSSEYPKEVVVAYVRPDRLLRFHIVRDAHGAELLVHDHQIKGYLPAHDEPGMARVA
jgi:hypothetical protein